MRPLRVTGRRTFSCGRGPGRAVLASVGRFAPEGRRDAAPTRPVAFCAAEFILILLTHTDADLIAAPVGAASLRPCGAQRHASRTMRRAPCAQTAGGQEARPYGFVYPRNLQPVGAASLRPTPLPAVARYTEAARSAYRESNVSFVSPADAAIVR